MCVCEPLLSTQTTVVAHADRVLALPLCDATVAESNSIRQHLSFEARLDPTVGEVSAVAGSCGAQCHVIHDISFLSTGTLPVQTAGARTHAWQTGHVTAHSNELCDCAQHLTALKEPIPPWAR